MTPVDDGLTRYFWFQHRNTDPNDESVSKFMNDGARMAFEEDRAVLTGVHKGMRDRQTPNIDLRLDAGAKLFESSYSRRLMLKVKKLMWTLPLGKEVQVSNSTLGEARN